MFGAGGKTRPSVDEIHRFGWPGVFRSDCAGEFFMSDRSGPADRSLHRDELGWG